MSVNGVNFSNNSSSVTFKGNVKRTEKGNPYYHSNSGTKIGTGLAVGMCGLLATVPFLNHINKILLQNNKKTMSSDKIEKYTKTITENKNNFKKILVPAIAAMGTYIACGAIIDYFRNKNAKKSADLVGRVGVRRAMAQDDNIEISKNNHPYYYSDQSAKKGALLGAVANTGLALIDNNNGVQATRLPKAGRLAGAAVVGAIGGAILGAWADHSSNKKADKLC